jgi:hypothetical protein
MNSMSQAASLMGRRSVEVRIKAWGKVEFTRRMREWGKKGGRPKGSGNKQTSKGGK